jgi:hypothetical protein
MVAARMIIGFGPSRGIHVLLTRSIPDHQFHSVQTDPDIKCLGAYLTIWPLVQIPQTPCRQSPLLITGMSVHWAASHYWQENFHLPDWDPDSTELCLSPPPFPWRGSVPPIKQCSISPTRGEVSPSESDKTWPAGSWAPNVGGTEVVFPSVASETSTDNRDECPLVAPLGSSPCWLTSAAFWTVYWFWMANE